MRGDITTSFCCDPYRTINIQANSLAVLYDTRADWVASLMVLFVHEARHSEGNYPHTCGGTLDQTIAEMGAWGVQYYLCDWLAFHTGQYFVSRNPSLGPGAYLSQMFALELNVLDYEFCTLPSRVGAAPSPRTFANTPLGFSSTTRTIGVTRLFGASVALGAVTIGGTNATDFAIDGTGCSNALLVTTCALPLRFAPAAAGAREATLSVRDAGGGVLVSVLLTGTGQVSGGVLVFRDDPLPARTTVKAVHLSELRLPVEAVRGRYGLGGVAWTDAAIAPGTTTVKAGHILELRAALADAYAQAGRAAPSYSDPALAAGMPVRSVHVAELRSAVLALW